MQPSYPIIQESVQRIVLPIGSANNADGALNSQAHTRNDSGVRGTATARIPATKLLKKRPSPCPSVPVCYRRQRLGRRESLHFPEEAREANTLFLSKGSSIANRPARRPRLPLSRTLQRACCSIEDCHHPRALFLSFDQPTWPTLSPSKPL